MNRFLYGMGCGAVVALIACAAVPVYRYYGLNVPSQCYEQGRLVGKEGSDGWPDLKFSQCAPDDQIKGKCWVELSSDHFAKEKDLQECHIALNECQKNSQAQVH